MNVDTEIWRDRQFPLPPRSKFYHLEPRGMGTPYVESLSGYAARLAQEHFVTPYALLKDVTPLGNTHIIRSINFSPIYRAINGRGAMAASFIKGLELLTMRADLASTTMVTWANVLPNNSLIRRNRSWCAACYERWREKGEVIYDPLLWALQAVTVCPLHETPLISACPKCEAYLPHLTSRSQPGFCGRCSGWLGLPEPVRSGKNLNTEEDAKWQMWKAAAIGELLAGAPNIKAPSREQVVRSVRNCLDHTGWGTPSRFAFEVKIRQSNLSSWVAGCKIPNLKSSLQITYRLGVSLLSFLCGTLEFENISQSDETGCKVINTQQLKKTALYNDEVKKILVAAASNSNTPPEPLHTYVKLTGWKYSKLKKYYPELCATIIARYVSYFHTPIDEAKALRILREALKENPPPSIAAVSRRIGCRGRWLKCHFPDLIKELVIRHEPHRRNIDWQVVKASLKEALIKDPPYSLNETARSLGLSAMSLRARFPELTKAIVRRFKKHVISRMEARDAQLRQEILEAIIALRSEGPHLSTIRIAARVKASRNIVLINRIRHDVEQELASNTIL